MRSYPSNPNYAPSPGRVVNTHLEFYEMSLSEFAKRCGRSVEFIQELISGKAPLDSEAASLIVKEFGRVAETWLGIEREYRQRLAHDADKSARREAIW